MIADAEAEAIVEAENSPPLSTTVFCGDNRSAGLSC